MVPRFLEEYHRGYDVVYALRINRKEGWLLRCCYRGFYRVIAYLSDYPLPQGAGDFSLMSRRVVDLLRGSPERHRYLRGLRSWVGFRQKGIHVERGARHAGTSKYTASKLFGLAMDGIFSFSNLPMRTATTIGAVTVGASLLFAAYAVLAKVFLNQSPQGFTALIVAITLLSGTHLMFLGIIGEYIGRIYDQVKQRPLYIVSQTKGVPCKSPTPASIAPFTHTTGGGEPAKSLSLAPSDAAAFVPEGPCWTSAVGMGCSSIDWGNSERLKESSPTVNS